MSSTGPGIGLACAVMLATTAAGAEVAEGARAPLPRGGAVAIDGVAFAAFVADADNEAVHRVDLTSYEVATTALPCAPEQVLVIDAERVAVTLRGCNQVALLAIDAAGEGSILATAKVPSEPWGLAVTPRGELLVSSAWGHALTVLDGATLDVLYKVGLAKEPRGVAVTPDGRRAFLTHVSGDAVSIVDLGGAARASEEARARRVTALGGHYRNRVESEAGAGTLHPTGALGYALALNEEGTRLFLPHLAVQNGSEAERAVSTGYGSVRVEEDTTVPSVAVLAVHDERVLGARPSGAKKHAPRARIPPNPRLEFAVAPGGSTARQARAAAVLGDALFVVSLGTDQLVELDARSLDPAMSSRKAYDVGAGPTGVDVDGRLGIAVVWNQFSHDLSIVNLGSGVVETVPVAADPMPADLAAGRRVFFSDRDRRTSRDGRACASCHPDGREDGLVWRLGSGPRQTPMLAGRLQRGPFGWLGKHDTLEANMQDTMMRLGGSGLPPADLANVAAYLRRGLVTPVREPDQSPRVARGKALFSSIELGCTNCHRAETQMTDHDVHDVGSKAKTDQTTKFRTPPLVFLDGTAPYFHDGRYTTLEQMIADNLDRMGNTSHLDANDRAALAAYLRTL
jgi:DNA-binding beta-propeller fold protein YncE